MLRLRNVAIVIVLGLMLVALGGCDLLFGTPKTGYTISGNLSGDDFPTSTPITISITDGTNSYTTQVYFTGGGTGESISYSISGVPAGTYSLIISFTTAYGLLGTLPYYSIDGGPQTTITPVNTSGDITETVSGVTIGSSETVDLYAGYYSLG